MNISPLITRAPQLFKAKEASLAVTSLTQTVADFTLKYIGAIRQSGFFMLGAQDIASGYKNRFYRWNLIGHDETVTRAFWKAVAGSTLLISGFFGLWSSIDYINKGYATPLNEQLFTAGNIFFLFSSILRLKTCIDDFLSAESRQEEISAMMGVGANICYIVSAAMMLFAPPAAFVIILCSVGTTTSFLQAIYDYALEKRNFQLP